MKIKILVAKDSRTGVYPIVGDIVFADDDIPARYFDNGYCERVADDAVVTSPWQMRGEAFTAEQEKRAKTPAS